MPSSENVPDVLTWDQRINGAQTMPGGYSGYLVSLREICNTIDESARTFAELASWMCTKFDISQNSSRMRLRFLERAGLVHQPDGVLRLGEHTSKWLTDDVDESLIAVLHSRVKFIGEMLRELKEPKSLEQLREITVTCYGLDWESPTQINCRRGWLESAKLIQGSSQRLELTQAGLDLLSRLETRKRDERHISVDARKTPILSPLSPDLEKLSTEILAASTDSKNPTRFELAVRDGFEFMGYVAKHLGGSGKTDVLLTAPLGRDSLYRVAVDAKTTASGSLGDNQVDWATLKEHRELHNADYSLLVAPRPAGRRLMDRAAEYSVCVMSADQLVDLFRAHAAGSLSLVEYKRLFVKPGEVDLTSVVELADQLERLRNIASTICKLLPQKTDQHGPMSARDILLVLDDEAAEVSESEIIELLEMLSHPLVGAVHRIDQDQSNGSRAQYILASSQSTTRRRIELLAKEIDEFSSDVAKQNM